MSSGTTAIADTAATRKPAIVKRWNRRGHRHHAASGLPIHAEAYPGHGKHYRKRLVPRGARVQDFRQGRAGRRNAPLQIFRQPTLDISAKRRDAPEIVGIPYGLPRLFPRGIEPHQLRGQFRRFRVRQPDARANFLRRIFHCRGHLPHQVLQGGFLDQFQTQRDLWLGSRYGFARLLPSETGAFKAADVSAAPGACGTSRLK